MPSLYKSAHGSILSPDSQINPNEAYGQRRGPQAIEVSSCLRKHIRQRCMYIPQMQQYTAFQDFAKPKVNT